jgi:hypothetical protein
LIYPENAPPAFHLQAKPSGATCNLEVAVEAFVARQRGLDLPADQLAREDDAQGKTAPYPE